VPQWGTVNLQLLSILVINFSLPIWTRVSESVTEIWGIYCGQCRLFVVQLMLSVQAFIYWKNKSLPHPNCILTVAVVSAEISLYLFYMCWLLLLLCKFFPLLIDIYFYFNWILLPFVLSSALFSCFPLLRTLYCVFVLATVEFTVLSLTGHVDNFIIIIIIITRFFYYF